MALSVCCSGIHGLPGYDSSHSYRSNKGGGGAALFIREDIPSSQLSEEVTPNN